MTNAINIEQSIRDIVHKVARDEVRQALAEALKPDEYLTPAAAAKLADVSPGTVRKWVRLGKLTPYREGKRIVRVSRNELEQLLKSGGASNDQMSAEDLAKQRFG